MHDCWSQVSINGMCAGSVPHYKTHVIIRMSEMMSWWHYMIAVQWNVNRMPADLVLFNQTCLLVHWKSKRKAIWLMPLHQTCLLTLWYFISQDCYIVNTTYMVCRELLCRCSCKVYACWPSVAVTNTAAVQICLPVECCCKMDTCWTVDTQSACLLAFCHSILHVCWHCASLSLSAIPAGLTISRVCWCGESL